MLHENPSRETTFGYLSTLYTAEHGYFGGYLIVSELGRPLEFHCTSPVRPSRAHEILYGPTLQPYLIGEQIGGALLQAADLQPRLVLTDQPAMLALGAQTRAPLALVVMPSDAGLTPTANETLLHETRFGKGRLTIGSYELQLADGFETERDDVAAALAAVAQQIDLAEPFGRIHEAIREAQRIGGRSSESHEQAA